MSWRKTVGTAASFEALLAFGEAQSVYTLPRAMDSSSPTPLRYPLARDFALEPVI
jgi:hypothetical protein